MDPKNFAIINLKIFRYGIKIFLFDLGFPKKISSPNYQLTSCFIKQITLVYVTHDVFRNLIVLSPLSLSISLSLLLRFHDAFPSPCSSFTSSPFLPLQICKLHVVGPTEDATSLPEARHTGACLPSDLRELRRDPPSVRGSSLKAGPF